MSKYIKKYTSLQNAKSDNSILSPNVSYIKEGQGEKILYADLGDNKNLVITGDTIEGAEIKEKVTITYSSAHGTTPESKQVASGYALVSSDLPTLSESGWEFKGWNKSVGDVISTNTTITASWEEESQMDYLTFTAQQAGSTIGMTHSGTNQTTTKPHIDYQINDGEWVTEWNGDSTITLQNVGDYVKMKGHNENGFNESTSKYSKFSMTGKIKASGNIMTLIDGIGEINTIPCDYYFYSLFYGCNSLVSAPKLQATRLKYRCYYYMFYGCSSLVNAPELPATTLATCCYQDMFSGCRSLQVAPELPATTLAPACYRSMFQGCSSLVTAPELPATQLSKECYYYMFSGCSSLQVAPSVLPATTLADYCYYYMFEYCSSLQVAPELPATTLATCCYNFMFTGCTSLINAPSILPATTLASYCYQSMFRDCSSLQVAPELPATTLAERCYSYMFSGCRSLQVAPELPATTLATCCYNFMFYNCSNLVNAPALPATTLAERCYSYMFSGCGSLVNAPELPATTLVSGCYNKMFYNCYKLNYISVSFTIWNTSCTTDWVYQVSPIGIFNKPDELPDQRGTSNIPNNWEINGHYGVEQIGIL